VRPVSIGALSIGGGHPFALVAGPCVIESAAHALDVAASLKEIAARCGVPVIFKASYDKANRTSRASFRGPGLDAGLRTLADIKSRTGLPTLTDIHEPAHAGPAAAVVDVLQIPAFLCRQTDLLVAAARTGKAVNVKKGQFLAPNDMRHVIDKITAEGNQSVLITERGVSFGYNNLVVDMRAFPMLRALGYPVVVAAGVDALFMEVHEDPSRAKSDAGNALRLDLLEPLLRKLTRIERAVSAQPVADGVRA
jgi:2-dehydro-3-deoxyphosphooctonate aldolase (KDO 8-P synthase)